MSRMIFFSEDKQQIIEFDHALIITTNYKLKLGKDQLLMPLAAKLIVYDGNVIHSFLLLKPLIKSDHQRNIIVMSNSKWKNISFQEKYLSGVKSLNKKLKLYKAKKTLGFLPNEIWAMQDLKAIQELKSLEKRKCKIQEGLWL